MAGLRLLLGDPSSPDLTIGEDAADSDNTDTAVDFGDAGFTFASTGPNVVFSCHIFVDAADAATLLTRQNNLRDMLNNKNRSVTIIDGSGSNVLKLEVGVDCSQVEISANFIASEDSCDVAVLFTGYMFLDGAGTGSAGTVENPTGLQDTPVHQVAQADDGTLVVTSSAVFHKTTTATALENASDWAGLWYSSAPSWLPSNLKEIGRSLEYERDTPEVRLTLVFAQQKDRIVRLGTTPSWVVAQEFHAEVTNSDAISWSNPSGNRPQAGNVITVSGSITLRLDGNGFLETDDATPTTRGGLSAVMPYARSLITAALSEAGASNSEAISGLELFMGDSGNNVTFTQQFLGGASYFSYNESMVVRTERLVTILRSYDGTDRLYELNRPLQTAKQTWNITGTSPPGTPPAPPGWEVLAIEATPATAQEVTDADGQHAATIYLTTGIRELRKVIAPAVPPAVAAGGGGGGGTKLPGSGNPPQAQEIAEPEPSSQGSKDAPPRLQNRNGFLPFNT